MFQTPWKKEKTISLIKRLAAEYLERAASEGALVTVTDATISPDRKRATIYLSVLPESEEKRVFESVKRKLSDIREYVGKHARMRVLPFIEVEIDEGEKNRQKIDELLKQ
jgi:ribosome-binding factor A